MAFEPHPPIRLEPIEIAPDTFVLRSAQRAFGAPLSVNVNSMVIRGAEPVVVDTGTRANSDAWLNDLTNLVDPLDVRWVFLSHDDEDHTGNLETTMEMCPNATLVSSWAATERMGCAFAAPPERLRWVDDGGALELPDRTLHAFRPPVYDSPTTRALFDSSTGVLWASDAFATPMPEMPVDDAADLPPQLWEEGMAMFHHHALSPWLADVDRTAFATKVARFRDLGPSVIAGAHTPTISGTAIETAFGLLASQPDVVPPPHPDQAVLEAALQGHGA